ncbi:hypothetical protein N7478_013306 [Penicillium angulare]|uniref:uncharacterized protein n=1 Tax=Penicillium angulare TaxID=116970 RepID=UPI00253FA25D|nr:uncharacterized protein N7478_013306 [Penicillium angulare]KAJ5257202.1 hypothetical protein N7478_013306 [Penicillium angulare]
MNSLRTSPLKALRSSRISGLQIAPSHIRYFHPTKPAPNLINVALDASTGLIHGVHNFTGLPWAASIPLTALLVRTAVGLPIQFHTRVHARRQRDLVPLVKAWKQVYDKGARNRNRPEGEAWKATQKQTKYLQQRWHVKSWAKVIPILQVPVWISLMEGIRGMCGNNSGLVPWLLSLFRPTKESADEAIQSLNMTVEPSLASEGALWFPDLLASDPTGALPVMLTASILLNVNTGWKKNTLSEMSDMPKLQMYQSVFFNGLRMFIQVLALNVGISGWYYEMPAALMIYWIASTNIATLQSWWLGKYMYSRPPLPTYNTKHIKFQGPGDPFKLNLK